MTDDNLRQALAIAIVSQKRRMKGEIEELAAKVTRIEEQLHQERRTTQDLRAATVRRLVASTPHWGGACGSSSSSRVAPSTNMGSAAKEELIMRSWLPPLSDDGGAAVAASSAEIDLGPLAARVAAAAANATTTAMTPATRAAMAGKAASLSSMLVANVRLLRALQRHGGGSSDGNAPLFNNSSSSSSNPVSLAAELCEFVAGPLLHTPPTTLSGAYMRECAVALAACVAGGAACGDDGSSVGDEGDAGAAATTAARAVVSRLIKLLFEVACFYDDAGGRSSSNLEQAQQQQRQAQLMLHALAALPPTGALLLAGAAQHLHRLCGALCDAQAALHQPPATAALAAAAHGAALFEAAQAVLDLFQGLCRDSLPVWAPALSAEAAPAGGLNGDGGSGGGADGGLLVHALAEAAAGILAARAALTELDAAYPLLSSAVCGAVSWLAAALQHIASAPGAAVGAGGGALRGATARLCVQLRDALLPRAPGLL